MKKDFTPEKELLFLALGGSGEIGMNVNLYGCDGKWLMVDLGMTFSGDNYPGVDLVFADLEFIEDRRDDLLGIVLTHGHEDHIGAIPYFAVELGVPLYATPFTAELIRRKLLEADITDEVELVVVEEPNTSFQVGSFNITYLPLAHSIAEGNALLIDTPYGRVFHTGDWKLDDEPIIGQPTTEVELTNLGDEGLLSLVCDSTNVFNPTQSGSEGEVRRSLLQEVNDHKGKRILVTTFASNVARLQTLGEVACATGRKLCVAGRSLEKIIEVSQMSGYLSNFPETVDFDTAMSLPRGELLILATGGQGEPRAALSRIAETRHPIQLTAGDVVLFSSKQIPGNELSIGRVMNQLSQQGILMITDRQSAIHVSGHPGRPELEALYSWLRPKVLVPVHGEARHLHEQARLGAKNGIPSTIVQTNGDILHLGPDRPRKLTEISSGRLVLDGDIIIPADGEAITIRRRLARDGLLIVVLDKDRKPKVEAVGLPLEEDMNEFLREAEDDVSNAIGKLRGKVTQDLDKIREVARITARRAAHRWSGKRPQVRVLMLEVEN